MQDFEALAHDYQKPEAPLRAFAVITTLFVLLLFLYLLLSPVDILVRVARIPLLHMALLAAATHKIAWLMSRDYVLSFLRAPVTRFGAMTGPGATTSEVPRGTGMPRALGELLSCAWCLSLWVAFGLLAFYLYLPILALFVALGFTLTMMADVLHLLYERLGRWHHH
jgi:hypothetical protein